MQTVQQAGEATHGLIGSYRLAYLVGAAVCGLSVVAAAFVRPTTAVGPLEPVSA